MRRCPSATDRLVLREWVDADAGAFAEMNADPVVMATIGPVMSRVESDRMLDRVRRHVDDHGFGLWCVEFEGEPIGFCGLSVPWFRDGVEIGWRLRSRYWGHGFATEAARSVLAHAFDALELNEVISFTAEVNVRSRKVMERIGLTYDPDEDFDHPAVADDNPLQPHVLYRIIAAQYRAGL